MSRGSLAGGSRLTADEAVRLSKPLLHLDLTTLSLDDAADRLRQWLHAVRPEVLNVAGPRASEDPGIGALVAALLRAAMH